MRQATESLIDEVRLLFHALVQIGDQLHAGSDISMGMRAVLEYLEREGATTVPDMARARRVTRQRIQTLVNALLERGLVGKTANPSHVRSPLIALTDAGAARIRRMREREGEALDVALPERRIRDAEATLRELRETLEKRGND